MKRKITHLQVLFDKNFCFLFLLLWVSSALTAQDMVTVSGLLQMEDGDPTPDIMISVNDGEYVAYTDENGVYSFSLPAGGDYVIRPVKEDEIAKGVNTLDMIFLIWHILGIDMLDSPYKQFAADVNNSASITTLDLVALQHVILGLGNVNFPHKDPWYFLYLNAGGTNPYSYVQQAEFTNLTEDQPLVDFVVIKTGDLNDSAFNFNGDQVSEHSDDQLLLSIDDRYVTAGETFTVDFVAENGKVLGYQFGIDFNPEILSLEGLIPGVAGEDNFGTQWAADGVLTTSWTSSEVEDLKGQVLFGLVFKAAGSGWLSDLLNVSSSYISAEAYDGAGEIIPVELYAKPIANVEQFKLYQNSPNPFMGQTSIAFDLPEGGEVKIKVLDASGKLLTSYEENYTKGHYAVTLDIPHARGVMYCRLECGQYVAVQKMMGF